jgi:type II secretory pathway component PulC
LEISIERALFIGAIGNIDNMNRVRLIEVVASDEVGRSEYPEYRLFSIAPKSAYAVLGFEEGDVLVAVNDYALNYSDRFRSYVQVLHLETSEVFAEIRRNGQPMILKWKFT